MKATVADRKTFVGVRLDVEQLARLDALAQGGALGLKAPRSEVIRLALERGLDVMWSAGQRSTWRRWPADRSPKARR